ncbi:uridine kinase [Lachnospiraceae bacterium KM106-2]|nr:uridine kinase [Lachnospiraceae bacterium KM106-2]
MEQMETMLSIIELKITEQLEEKSSLVIAIDGRCCAGKTTLARQLEKEIPCNVFHMDDFFLRPGQRTKERLAKTGETIDHERFEQDILRPLGKKESFSYRPYSCRQQRLLDEIKVSPSKISLIEGSYSCHPSLRNYYDMAIFLDVETDEQMRRIQARNGAYNAILFERKWIPLEEAYFQKYKVKEHCDLVFRT